jgi:hypothetical protein
MKIARDVKGFILGSTFPQTAVNLASGRDTEMFGEVCKLQKLSFFSIGHSLAALAFVVCGALKTCRGAHRTMSGSLGWLICTA